MSFLKIGKYKIGIDYPTWFIADISANHDGDLNRAIDLIHLAAENGANAAKFQNFQADEIVSDHGFKSLDYNFSHQSKWKQSVTEVYRNASLPWDWTPLLKTECDKAGIEFLSTPYDLPAVDMLNPFVSSYKIGSGDITYHQIIDYIASKHKPTLLATGASCIEDVVLAVDVISKHKTPYCIMQCNTNYTASCENFKHIHLNVLHQYRKLFPEAILGLSDHTSGHATVLGAVSIGARIIEKHFTDNNLREGPDHLFSMNNFTWKEMIERTRELEYSLGKSEKFVANNESDTFVVQRRCIRSKYNIDSGTLLKKEHFEFLRPAPLDSFKPYEINTLLNKQTLVPIAKGDYFKLSHIKL